MKINVSPEDNIFHLISDVAASITGPTPLHYSFTVVMYGTWGNPYDDDPGGHGWSLTITNRWHAGAFSHDVIWRIPHEDFTDPHSGPDWIDPLEVDVKFLDKFLNTNCSTWTVGWVGKQLDIGGVNVYADTDVGGTSGTGYQSYYNTQFAQVEPTASLLGPPETPECGVCPSTSSSWDDSIVELTGECEFWWEHGGTVEDIKFEHDQPIPPQSCPCVEPLSAGYPDEDKLHHVIIPVYSTERFVRTEIGPGVCTCDGEFLYSYPLGRYNSKWHGLRTTAHADETSGPNRETVETSGSRCWASGGAPTFDESTPTITTRTEQYSRWYCEITVVVKDIGCAEPETSPPICTPGIGGGGGVLDCTDIEPCYGCKYQAYSRFDWPEETPCQPSDDAFHLTRATAKGTTLAVVMRPAGLYFQRYDRSSVVEEILIVASVSVNSAQIAWDSRDNVLVGYDQGGTIKAVRSYSLGKRWTDPETITTGAAWPAVAVDQETGMHFLSLHDGDDYVLYRAADHTADFELIGSIVTVAAANRGRCALEWQSRRLHELLFAYQDGASIKELRSHSVSAEVWEGPVSIASGTLLALAISDEDGTEWVALLVSGTWKLYRHKPETSWALVGNIIAGPSKQAGLEVGPERLGALIWLGNDGTAARRLLCHNQLSIWN